MIIDANANVGPTVYDDFEFEPTLDALSNNLAGAGIDRALVAPLKPPTLDFDRANAQLAARLQQYERFTGIARIDPRVTGAADHAVTALDEYGFAGLKLHPWEETFAVTSGMADPVLEVAVAHDVPVWIHAGYPNVSHALSLRELAQSFPAVPLVLTHGAQLDISGLSLTDALALARDTENTYFELSGVYRLDLVQDLVETVGAERVVFGTNAPYFHPEVELSRVTDAAIPDGAKETILADAIEGLL